MSLEDGKADREEGLELLDIGVGLFDRARGLTYCNPAFRALRRYPAKLCRPGVSLEALLRYNAERGDFGPGTPDVQVAERLQEIEASAEREIEREMADGQILSIRYRRTRSGGLAVTFQDRTAERRAERALRSSEERYALVTQATSDGIYDWNVTEDLLFVSSNLNRLIDLDLTSKSSTMWVERIHPDDAEGYVESLRAHFRGETPAVDTEYRLRAQGGGYRWVHDRGLGMRGSNGRVERLVGAVSDITAVREAKSELKQVRDRLFSSLGAIADGILLVDPDNRVQLFNERYVEIFRDASGGADLSDVVVKGRPFFEMIREGYELGMFKPHPGGVEQWLAERKAAWKKPAVQWELELANGTWILLNERRMADGGRVAAYTDITQMKEREGEAQAARQRFEEAIEAITSGFALWDADDRLLVSNTRYRDYFADLADVILPGMRFDEIVGAGIERGLFPLAADDPEGYLAKTAKTRAQANGQAREQYISGHWLQVTDHRTAEGGIVSIYTDVTERKRTEISLKAAVAEFNAVLDSIDYGVLFMGPDLRARIVNRAFGRIWKVPQDFIDSHPTMREMIEYNRDSGLYDVTPEDWDDWVEARVAQVAAGDVPPLELQRGDGSVLTYQCVALPDGGRMLTYFDITELKNREAEIGQARDRAEQALLDLQQAQDRLVQSEKMASLGQLTAGIAHEIKNPLNFVNNFAKLSDDLLDELTELIKAPLAQLEAEDREDAEEVLATLRGNLEKIASHGRRADSIIKNMLQHCREGPSECSRVAVNALAEEALNLAYHGARAENPGFNVEIVKELDPAVGEIDCYPQDLLRVLLNLISNGLYATGKRLFAEGSDHAPVLSLRTHDAGERIEIEVHDNGSGISPELREKIFLPFFTTKPTGEGTGLGLSLSYDIVVKQHGGSLSVDSEPGLYTAFTVSLPRHQEART